MKKLSLILCIVLCMSMFSCAIPTNDPDAETTKSLTTPEVTPEEVTPDESTPEVTPEITTPAESKPETTPNEGSPADSTTEHTPETTPETTATVESSTDEPTETTPNGSETTGFYHYEKLPDASEELSAELMTEIEGLVDAKVDWEEHYLGTFKDYVLFGVVRESDAEYVQYYSRREFCFGFFTDLYGYKDGEIYTFRELVDTKVYDMLQIYYIAYMGAKKAIGELPDFNEEVSAETIQIIKEYYRFFEPHYYGTYNGYILVGSGPDITDMNYYVEVKNATYHFRTGSAHVYSPETGFLEMSYAINDDTINIEYEDVVRAVMISCLRDIPGWMQMYSIPLPKS